MQTRQSMISTAAALLLALGMAGASAGLSIERNISITDDHGGTLVMLTLGVRDELGGESSTTATFSDFQAAPDRRRVSGQVIRERIRSADRVEKRFNGALDIVTPGDDQGTERLDTLVFENVTIVREGEYPVLSGEVIYNGETRAVADLPRPAIRMLARVLRFFHFA